jgi:glycosyltransferase involved in cell wall biosynthesis
MTKPRVLVVTTYYHPVIGGVESHARQLVQYLRASGYQVEVVTKRIGASDGEGIVDEVPVHRIGPAGERSARGKWTLVPALFATLMRSAARFDVFVCIDYRGIGLAAIAAGTWRKRPVIAQGEVAGVLAGADGGSASGLAPETALARALKAPVRAVYRRADRIVCIGRDLEREALRAGVARERVEYLPHGVDLDRFRPAVAGERDEIRRALGWPVDRPVVLFVGRLSVEKGVMDLLAAWRMARPAAALLVLVGPDMTGHPWDAGASGRAFVAAHQLGESVCFQGHASDPSRFYRAADVFTQPSHFEALGNTALEAMASGLPVIASRVGGLVDFCVDGENALLHPPHDAAALAQAMTTMLGDAALRERLGAAGRRTTADRFEAGALLARYADLIDTVAGRR